MTAFLDVCRFTPTLGGTTDWTYSSAVTGYQSPAAANAVNGAIYRYRAESADLSQWEVGTTTYNSGTGVFARTAVLFNSSGNTSKINFSTVPQVAIVALAEDLSSFASAGFVNKIRNGTFDTWQRGTASITITTAGAYAADGWIVTPTGASCTAIQAANNNTGANTLYGLQVTGATGVTDIQVAQRIESNIAAALAGKTVTVQAQVYNNTGGSITPTLTTKYAGSTDNWTSPTTDLGATNLQACANGAWTLVSYTLSVSANATRGYAFILDFGNNFSTTGKDVVIAEADARVTSGIPTGLNTNPPPPELRPVFAELEFNRRYYLIGAGEIQGYAGGTASTMVPLQWIMRAAPTTTSSWTNIQNTNSGSVTALSASGGYAYMPSSASNVTVQASFTFTASAEL